MNTTDPKTQTLGVSSKAPREMLTSEEPLKVNTDQAVFATTRMSDGIDRGD